MCPQPAVHRTAVNIPSTNTVLPIRRLHPSAYGDSWRGPKRVKRPKRSPHRYKSIQSGTFDTLSIVYIVDHSGWTSFQDALRTFFQPIKTDDPRLDFYTMYKREAMEYDTDYVKKYDEDLNTTLIFVRYYHSLSLPISFVLLGGSLLCR